MKTKVIKTFRDKYTKEYYRAGSVAEFAGVRIQEITEYLPGFIEVIGEPSVVPPAEPGAEIVATGAQDAPPGNTANDPPEHEDTPDAPQGASGKVRGKK
jgi:hypothetical protein